jgi:hypothetical protein
MEIPEKKINEMIEILDDVISELEYEKLYYYLESLKSIQKILCSYSKKDRYIKKEIKNIVDKFDKVFNTKLGG